MFIPAECAVRLNLLVRGYSRDFQAAPDPFSLPENQPDPAATTDDEIRNAHSHVVDMGIDEVSERILNNTLHVGSSGRPV